MTAIANSENLTTISKSADLITLINTFTVEPENQEQLVELLVKITEDVMCKRPGFIAANLHKSLDGKQVANYAQWRSVENFEDMLKFIQTNERHRYLRAEVSKIATMNPYLYEVCYTNNP